MSWIKKIFTKKQSKKFPKTNIVDSSVYVTMDWSGDPITTKAGGGILPRKAEMILNGKYYPNGKVGEWPCDPLTGKKLEIEPH